MEYFGNGNPLDVAVPVHTVTAKDREAVTAASLCKFYGGVVGAEMSEPLRRDSNRPQRSERGSLYDKFKGQDIGQEPFNAAAHYYGKPGGVCSCGNYCDKVPAGGDMRYWTGNQALLK